MTERDGSPNLGTEHHMTTPSPRTGLFLAILGTVALTTAFVVLPTITAPAAHPHPVTPTMSSFTVQSALAEAPTVSPEEGRTAKDSPSPDGDGDGSPGTRTGDRDTTRTGDGDVTSTRDGDGDGDRDTTRAGAGTGETETRLAALGERAPVAEFTLLRTWDAGSTPAGTTVSARVREHGTWQAWQSLSIIDDGGPDRDDPERSSRTGTDPLFTEGADGFQVRISSATGSSPEGLRVDVIDAGRSEADELSVQTAATASAAPSVVTRKQWGADERLRKPTGLNSTVKALVLHHTAGSNSYSSAAAFTQVRGIYAYHTLSLGWSDIAYNLLVDRFGRIYEGRAGSLVSAVRGAHAGGFNSYTYGISVMGNYDVAKPPPAAVSGIKQAVAWKAARYGLAAKAKTTLTSAGGGTARWPAGTTVTVPTIMGHITVGQTACPGRYLIPYLPAIRDAAGTGRTSTTTRTRTTSSTRTRTTTTPTTTVGSPGTGKPPSSFTLAGSGYGHGVGMSQYGARAQATKGRGAKRILAAYYTGTSVTAVRDTQIIRVQVLGGVSSAVLSSDSLSGSSGGRFRAAVGGTVLTGTDGDRLTVTPTSTGLRAVVRRASGSSRSAAGSTVTVRWQGTRHYGGGATVMTVGGSGGVYRHGRLELTRVRGKVNVVARMRLHDEYLYGIDEMPSSWPGAALRAQATAARTNAVLAVRKGVQASCDCHLTDNVGDQRFTGWVKEGEGGTGANWGARWTKAVRDSSSATRGVGYVVSYRGTPVPAYWFSSSGGRTENSEDVWSTALPHTRSIADSWSLTSANPNRSWTKVVSQKVMATAFGLPDVVSLRLTRTKDGGSVRTVVATSSTGRTARLSGRQLRTALGLRSAWVSVTESPSDHGWKTRSRSASAAG